MSDLSELSVGDDVEGYLDGDSSSSTVFYVTDMSDEALALQDTETSFGYVREDSEVFVDPIIED